MRIVEESVRKTIGMRNGDEGNGKKVRLRLE